MVARLQKARTAVLKDFLKQRNEAHRDFTNENLNQIYSKLQKEKEAKLHKIHNDYMRGKSFFYTDKGMDVLHLMIIYSKLSFFVSSLSIELRKLEAERKNVEGKLQRRDIVTDSQTWDRRRTRRDTFTIRNTTELREKYFDTYEGSKV